SNVRAGGRQKWVAWREGAADDAVVAPHIGPPEFPFGQFDDLACSVTTQRRRARGEGRVIVEAGQEAPAAPEEMDGTPRRAKVQPNRNIPNGARAQEMVIICSVAPYLHAEILDFRGREKPQVAQGRKGMDGAVQVFLLNKRQDLKQPPGSLLVDAVGSPAWRVRGAVQPAGAARGKLGKVRVEVVHAQADLPEVVGTRRTVRCLADP